MRESLFQQFLSSIRAPSTAKRYRDAGIGVAFVLLSQLLVAPLQVFLDRQSAGFPASIIVMLLLFGLLFTASVIFEGSFANFYTKHVRGPSDFVGRHMSFGFVAEFILLNRDHIKDVSNIWRVLIVFVTTTIVGYLATFLLAFVGFKIESRLRGSQRKPNDLENDIKRRRTQPFISPVKPLGQAVKRVSQLSTISVTIVNDSSLVSPASTSSNSTPPQWIEWVVRMGPMWICLCLLVTVGIPIYLARDYEMPFEFCAFTLSWITAVQFQRCLKSSSSMRSHFPSPARSALIILTNPLITTSALASAYLWAKTAYTGEDISSVVAYFRHHGSPAESIIEIAKDYDLAAHLGAGDLTALILDAGIVCLGFKMFEYRAELWASGATVTIACVVLAVVSVFFNVFFAHVVGLAHDEAVAFVGRSTTIALGVPAVKLLGGSTTMMSSLAIFSGIFIQIIGDWLLSAFHIRDQGLLSQARSEQEKKESKAMVEDTGIPAVSSGFWDVGSTPSFFKEKEEDTQESKGQEESKVVAAGVTIGINAAAMGTCFLIERDSRATAYSALSMTIFGVATIALSRLQHIQEVIRGIVA